MHSYARALGFALVSVVGAGCTVPQTLPRTTAAAPIEFVAYLCADACRIEFAAADPLPYHAGAPVTRRADGSYEVRYQRREDGRWTPRTAGRLLASLTTDGSVPETLRYEPTATLLGWRDPVAEIVVRIEPADGEAMVRLESWGADIAPVARHLQAAAAFATALAHSDGDAAMRPCCAHHARWRAVALLRAAAGHERAGRLVAARDALRAALADAPQLVQLDHRIGALDRALGQDELAAPRLLVASRRVADPVARSSAAAAARASAARMSAAGPALRDAALLQLGAGRMDSAGALAQAARQADPDPIADLRLRHRLQRASKDRLGSLGTALLLREYDADAAIDRVLVQDFATAGHWEMARRAATRLLAQKLPTAEVLTALHSARDHLATEPWIRWVESAAALAMPAR